MFTGRIIRKYIDDNPESPTYNQIREEYIVPELGNYCDSKCNMIKIDQRYDEDDNIVETWKDNNPNSPTFNQEVEITSQDTTPKYTNFNTSCETKLYNGEFSGNSGRKYFYYMDLNPYSPTYRSYFYPIVSDDSIFPNNTNYLAYVEITDNFTSNPNNILIEPEDTIEVLGFFRDEGIIGGISDNVTRYRTIEFNNGEFIFKLNSSGDSTNTITFEGDNNLHLFRIDGKNKKVYVDFNEESYTSNNISSINFVFGGSSVFGGYTYDQGNFCVRELKIIDENGEIKERFLPAFPDSKIGCSLVSPISNLAIAYTFNYEEDSPIVISSYASYEKQGCKLPNTEPIRSEFPDRSCKLVTYPSGQIGSNGIIVLSYKDVNPYSPTYGQQIGSSEEVLSQTGECYTRNLSPYIYKTCEYCELEDGVKTGRLISYQRDINLFSETYSPDIQEIITYDNVKCPGEVLISGHVLNDPYVTNNLELKYVRIRLYKNDTFKTMLTSKVLTDFAFQFNVSGLDFNRVDFLPINDSYCINEYITDIYFTTPAAKSIKWRSQHLIFGGLHNLKSLYNTVFDFQNIVDYSNAFDQCESLEELDFTSDGLNWDFTNVESLYNTFRYCENLESIKFVADSSDDIIQSTNLNSLGGTFMGCTNITELTVPFLVDSVTDFQNCFSDCTSLENLYLPDWNITGSPNFIRAFKNCNSLQNIYMYGSSIDSVSKIRTAIDTDLPGNSITIYN